MIRAIIFDFNGVIADDETLHVLCFQKALAEQSLSLTKEEYYGTYLGMDERTCAAALLTARDGRADGRQLQTIIDRKSALFQENTASHTPPLFPGVVEFITQARSDYRLAIASGGRREQIDQALRGTPIERSFAVILPADDCAVGKPDPAIYRHTLKLLNAREPRPPLLTAQDCLVIEDSVAGIRSAQAAGMKVLAVATTYPAERLKEADAVVEGFQGLTVESALRSIAG
jgi:HAD superfamily hydrolase (TIGR01509 family)